MSRQGSRSCDFSHGDCLKDYSVDCDARPRSQTEAVRHFVECESSKAHLVPDGSEADGSEDCPCSSLGSSADCDDGIDKKKSKRSGRARQRRAKYWNKVRCRTPSPDCGVFPWRLHHAHPDVGLVADEPAAHPALIAASLHGGCIMHSQRFFS